MLDNFHLIIVIIILLQLLLVIRKFSQIFLIKTGGSDGRKVQLI